MKESIIVFGALTGILLPVRLVFVEYFSDDWFGSFGLISIISIAIVILAKKQKLGKFGKMFENEMMKIHQGKRRIMVYTFASFIVLYLSLSIYSINEGNSTYLEEKNLLMQEFKEKDINLQNMIEKMPKMSPERFMEGITTYVFSWIENFKDIAIVNAINNDYADGYILHFHTVFLVEQLEVIGILIFYRFYITKEQS
jgi:K+ transporter